MDAMIPSSAGANRWETIGFHLLCDSCGIIERQLDENGISLLMWGFFGPT